MAVGAVRVEGLRDVQRAFRKIDKDLAKELRDRLKAAAEPVRAESEREISALNPRSGSRIRTAVRSRGVSVEQPLRRTTGKRPDWGALQIRRLREAAERNEEKVVDEIEDGVREVIRRAGF